MALIAIGILPCAFIQAQVPNSFERAINKIKSSTHHESLLIKEIMENINNLKKNLAEKTQQHFQEKEAYLDYILQTKNNFLHRYLENSNNQNIIIQRLDTKTLIATSYEENMGEAFRISDLEIKEAVKNLAKLVTKEHRPKIQYTLETILENLSDGHGKIIIMATINWDFPLFPKKTKAAKTKEIIFSYKDPHEFRKYLAIKYEAACELFI